ncbi:MAG: hypothetical protein WDN00_15490 [Limisphaerales bacterium]
MSDPYYQVGSVDFNGIRLFATNQFHTPSNLTAVWLANTNTNQVVITVYGTNNNVIANDWLTFELAPPFTVTNGAIVTTYTAISNVVYSGQQRPNICPRLISVAARAALSLFQPPRHLQSLSASRIHLLKPVNTHQFLRPCRRHRR